jgi:tetratricopeptide (TPR) repeat protein
MSDTNLTEIGHDGAATQPQDTDFEVLLGQAERLLDSSELEAALEQLLVLQEKYVAATRLFDIIGDAYMRRSDFEQGIRYKTLHEVLKSTLNSQRLSRPQGRERAQASAARKGDLDVGDESVKPQGAPASPPITHCTSAMGHELLRQGHYEKALEIFDTLLEKKPGDDALLEARDAARKKLRERRVLGVLEKWLNNIESMKSGRTREP